LLTILQNIKEHALITIMSNVTIGFASGSDASNMIQAAKKFYDFDLSAGLAVLMVMCTQLLGFGVAGLGSRWVVEPASIIWPGILGNCALLSTLHSKSNAVANGWKISRLRFFFVALHIAFVWYWFPGLIFTALSYFTWICWIAPNNAVVNQIFGMQTGLGMLHLGLVKRSKIEFSQECSHSLSIGHRSPITRTLC
jgi:hypothetical protein